MHWHRLGQSKSNRSQALSSSLPWQQQRRYPKKVEQNCLLCFLKTHVTCCFVWHRHTQHSQWNFSRCEQSWPRLHCLCLQYLLCLWLAVPLLRTLTNRDETIKSTHAYLTMAVPSNEGRETLLPVRLEGETAIPLFGRSGLITPLTEADGFLRIPRGSEGAAAGEQVEVYAFSAFSDGR